MSFCTHKLLSHPGCCVYQKFVLFWLPSSILWYECTIVYLIIHLRTNYFVCLCERNFLSSGINAQKCNEGSYGVFVSQETVKQFSRHAVPIQIYTVIFPFCNWNFLNCWITGVMYSVSSSLLDMWSADIFYQFVACVFLSS